MEFCEVARLDFLASCTFNRSDTSSIATRQAIAQCMRDHGFIVLHVDNIKNEMQKQGMMNWEEVFKAAFGCSSEGGAVADPVVTSPYRSEHGATLGVRRDDTRKFFETRRTFDHHVDPDVPSVTVYSAVVLALFQLLGDIGRDVAGYMATELGLEAEYFTDLMDGEDIPEAEHFSSSVLRICNYTPGHHDTACCPGNPDIAFGSHTDTSFVTVAPVSSNNGLEIRDLMDGSWHMAEVGAPQPSVVVFAGECLQMLTKSYYRAAVHRVRVTGINNRVSCPFIMRGRKKALIKNISEDVMAALKPDKKAYIADLDGASMGLIHKMLDFKRVKCRKHHENSTEDWVLAAYPCTVGPLQVEAGADGALAQNP